MNTGEGDQRRLGLSVSPELALWGSQQLEGRNCSSTGEKNKLHPTLGQQLPVPRGRVEPQGEAGQAS